MNKKRRRNKRSIYKIRLEEKNQLIKETYGNFGTPGIYSITCLENKKRYIGSSSNIEARWFDHLISLHRKSHHNKRIQKDYSLFGEQKFIFKIECKTPELTREELYHLEQRYIDSWKPEYNIVLKVDIPPPKKGNSFPAKPMGIKLLRLTG